MISKWTGFSTYRGSDTRRLSKDRVQGPTALEQACKKDPAQRGAGSDG
jgi:hypothetical protein